MLHEEVARFSELSGEDAHSTSISRIGGYLDGYEKGKEDGIAEANLAHNAECGDCIRQITAADVERIRADERKKVIEKIRELKKHSGNTSFCTKEHCPSHEDIACYDCMDAILNYVEKDSSKEQEGKNGNS